MKRRHERILPLLERAGPVLSWFQVCELMEEALLGEHLLEADAAAWRRALIYKGHLKSYGRSARGLYRNTRIAREPVAAEYLCAALPTAYLVYFSALHHHGMTLRVPNDLQYSVRKWRSAPEALGFRPSLPPLPEQLITLPLRKRALRGPIEVRELPQPRIGVASRAWTLVHAVRKPAFCGGWSHVGTVLQRHLAAHASEVVRILEENGSAIDKVRFGYILDEVLGLQLPILSEWEKLAQRGGSRVLVVGRPYADTYSERWCLSLNT